MDKKYIHSIEPITKDKFVWDAFNAILNYEKDRLITILTTYQSSDQLIRINAKIELLAYLTKYKEITERAIDGK